MCWLGKIEPSLRSVSSHQVCMLACACREGIAAVPTGVRELRKGGRFTTRATIKSCRPMAKMSMRLHLVIIDPGAGVLRVAAFDGGVRVQPEDASINGPLMS